MWYCQEMFLRLWSRSFVRFLPLHNHGSAGRATVITITVAMVAVVYYMSIFSKQLATFMHVDTDNPSYRIMLGICQLYAMFACFLILMVQRTQRKEIQALRLLEKNNEIWNQRRLQYQLSRENMELMNRKFHDMKHQIAAISRMEGKQPERDAFIQMKNTFEGALQFQGNVPMTSKEDKANHGYGMRSIQTIAEKYHGTMSVKMEDGFFILNVLIPVK